MFYLLVCYIIIYYKTLTTIEIYRYTCAYMYDECTRARSHTFKNSLTLVLGIEK